jgi:site-specific DNA recombinase
VRIPAHRRRPHPQPGQELDAWLTKALDPRHLPATLDALTAAQDTEPAPEGAVLPAEIAACQRRLTQYRAALDNGGDPVVVGGSITETQARKLATEGRLRTHATGRAPSRMTRDEIAAVVDAITGLMSVLSNAESADKAEIYARHGLRPTYNPRPRTVTGTG